MTEDSEDLTQAKYLYDKMFEARKKVDTFRGIKATAPKSRRIDAADAVLALRNADVELAQYMKQLNQDDLAQLHIYGRQKQGLPT